LTINAKNGTFLMLCWKPRVGNHFIDLRQITAREQQAKQRALLAKNGGFPGKNLAASLIFRGRTAKNSETAS
jgi:uncharacterized protein YigE (DUF2233 family)